MVSSRFGLARQRRNLAAAAALGEELGPHTSAGGGPGGWILLYEPELHYDEPVTTSLHPRRAKFREPRVRTPLHNSWR